MNHTVFTSRSSIVKHRVRLPDGRMSDWRPGTLSVDHPDYVGERFVKDQVAKTTICPRCGYPCDLIIYEQDSFPVGEVN